MLGPENEIGCKIVQPPILIILIFNLPLFAEYFLIVVILNRFCGNCSICPFKRTSYFRILPNVVAKKCKRDFFFERQQEARKVMEII